jgi:hypothetical protein
MRIEDRGERMEDGGWRMEDGGWRIEDGGWRIEDWGLRTEDEVAGDQGGPHEYDTTITNQSPLTTYQSSVFSL